MEDDSFEYSEKDQVNEIEVLDTSDGAVDMKPVVSVYCEGPTAPLKTESLNGDSNDNCFHKPIN